MSRKLFLQEDNEMLKRLEASVNVFASNASENSKEPYIIQKRRNQCKCKIKGENLLLILTLAGKTLFLLLNTLLNCYSLYQTMNHYRCSYWNNNRMFSAASKSL